MEIVHRLWWLFHSEKNKCHRLSIHFPSHFSPALSPHTRTLAFVGEKRGAADFPRSTFVLPMVLSPRACTCESASASPNLFLLSFAAAVPFTAAHFRRSFGGLLGAGGACGRTRTAIHHWKAKTNDNDESLSPDRPTDRPQGFAFIYFREPCLF